ncbi:unnamed protein product [marine sediment metagenome]|uniref:Uncharacterized protein n=1 Tax=marine sediment metagenome TaxID=412755 RepID=X0YAE8_9ZZZZ
MARNIHQQHIAVLHLTAAIEFVANDGDPDEMLFPIQCVPVDDCLAWCIHDAADGRNVWIRTWDSGAPGSFDRTANAERMDADEIADLPNWTMDGVVV